MRRSAARLGTVLCAAGLAIPAAVLVATPAVAVRGVSVQIQDMPDEFGAGNKPTTFAAVATKNGGSCIKVRWSMVLRVEGMRLDQARVDRIEDNGAFPVDVQTRGDAARLTDVEPDPGTLCRDRTVTARYAVNFADDVAGGQVTFEVEAYDSDLRLLEKDSATRPVVNPDAAPTPSPEPPSPEPTGEPATGPGAGAGAPPDANAASAGIQIPRPPIGFIVGAVMFFLGTGLLLQVRRRNRREAGRAALARARGGMRHPPARTQRPTWR